MILAYYKNILKYMSKKLILVFVGVIFFSSCPIVFASVVINEIMYNPTQDDAYNEWIELYNTDSSQSQDLSNLTLCGTAVKSGYIEKNSSSISNDNGLVLGAGQYAIITDGGSGTQVYDNFSIPSSSLALHADSSSMCGGLSNTGATISLGGASVDSVSYTSSEGADGDGNSLQLVNASWVAASPTPGAQNVASAVSTTSSTTYNSATADTVGGGGLPADYSNNNSASDSSTTTNTPTQTQEIKTQIIAKTLDFVGLPVAFQANSLGVSGEKMYFGKYFWNFGDGDSKEMNLTDPEPFNHTYYYPGNYIVSLDYFQNAYGGDLAPDTSSQINIKIIPADISISSVGDEKDFFVEIANNTDYNADISGWMLQSAQKSFVFPRNTIIVSKQTMTISPKITGFSVADENTLKLIDSAGNTIFDYNASSAPVVAVANTVDKPTLVRQPKESSSAYVNDEIPAVNNLSATALSSNIPENTSTPTSSLKKILTFIFAFVFIGAAASAVYFIRRKNFVINGADESTITGKDFEILDD